MRSICRIRRVRPGIIEGKYLHNRVLARRDSLVVFAALTHPRPSLPGPSDVDAPPQLHFMRHLLSVALLSVAFLTASAPAANNAKDARRMSPVPAGQSIPIEDFFRPPLWIRPSLNPSGTHLAGLVDTGEDRYHLLTYDLKTQKTDVPGGDAIRRSVFGSSGISHRTTWFAGRRARR